MRLHLLGTGGWQPSATRETACALLVDGDDAILLDAGTGVRRLTADPAPLAGVRRLTVLLTHYHVDHVVGLAYLAALRVPGLALDAVGPGLRAYDEPTAATLARLLDPPLFAAGLARVLPRVEDLPADGPLVRGPFALTWRVQRRHPQPTIAYRLGDALAWCTDTGPDPETAGFARGVRLLAHEAMAGTGPDDPWHTRAADAAAIARDAGAGGLLLIHVDPFGDEDAALRAARAVLPAARLATDGLVLDLAR